MPKTSNADKVTTNRCHRDTNVIYVQCGNLKQKMLDKVTTNKAVACKQLCALVGVTKVQAR